MGTKGDTGLSCRGQGGGVGRVQWWWVDNLCQF